MDKNKFYVIITAFAAGILGTAVALALFINYADNEDFRNFFALPDNFTDKVDRTVEDVDGKSVDTTVPQHALWDERVPAVVERVQPAVVAIAVTKDLPKYRRGTMDPFFKEFLMIRFFNDFFSDREFGSAPQGEPEYEETRVGGGSGFFVSSDGMIVTNRHVIKDIDADYTVITSDGEEHEATVLARDPVYDLAYLKIEGQDFSYLEFADSDQIKLGQSVLAIGNALDEFRNTVTSGIISGLNRTLMAGTGNGTSEVLEQAIQTDAAINPGNSGGPLLNLDGQVIGVNTAMSLRGQLIGFALPSNLIQRGLKQVRETGKIARAWLGVRYQLVTDELIKKNNLQVEHGAIILRGQDPSELAVIPGSPADKAGLRENDIILEVEDKKITPEHSLVRAIAGRIPGEEIILKISRAGEERTIKVTLEERE